MSETPSLPPEIAHAEKNYAESEALLQAIKEELERLKRELHEMTASMRLFDEQAQQELVALRELLEQVTIYAIEVAREHRLDKMELQTRLSRAVTAYRGYIHSLLTVQKYTSGEKQAQNAEELKELQASLRLFEEKMVAWGFDLPPLSE